MGLYGVQGLAASAGGGASKDLKDAHADCDFSLASTGIDLNDRGCSLTFDSKGEKDLTGANSSDIVCLLAALKVPSSVASHIDQTTSMDGRQTETWDRITISWSYHPSRGFDGVISVN